MVHDTMPETGMFPLSSWEVANKQQNEKDKLLKKSRAKLQPFARFPVIPLQREQQLRLCLQRQPWFEVPGLFSWHSTFTCLPLPPLAAVGPSGRLDTYLFAHRIYFFLIVGVEKQWF